MQYEPAAAQFLMADPGCRGGSSVGLHCQPQSLHASIDYESEPTNPPTVLFASVRQKAFTAGRRQPMLLGFSQLTVPAVPTGNSNALAQWSRRPVAMRWARHTVFSDPEGDDDDPPPQAQQLLDIQVSLGQPPPRRANQTLLPVPGTHCFEQEAALA